VVGDYLIGVDLLEHRKPFWYNRWICLFIHAVHIQRMPIQRMPMTSATGQSDSFRIWLAAARPRTLPLAVASIVMGSSLAVAQGAFDWRVALLSVSTAILLQILSNLANDYGDWQHGADRSGRQGPPRAVQSGVVAPDTMRMAIALTALLAILSGLALLWLAFGRNAFSLALVFLVLGAAAIGAAISYTAGKLPYGYAGLGDLSVLLFFGWVGVVGSYFTQTQRFDWLIFLPATSCGLLAVAVLNVNNIRDLDSDRQAGKQTIPVRLGLGRARVYHWWLLSLAVFCALVYVMLRFSSLWQLLFLLAVPLLVRNALAVSRPLSPAQLNPWLKQMSVATLLFVILFSLGQLL
jgi:1,4-dihydroxy-2-naphthoate octaprenyltransferase